MSIIQKYMIQKQAQQIMGISYQNKDTTPTFNISNSADAAEIVLGLCEGEIEGLQNGAKSFYINGTSLQNQSGDANFKDFKLEIYKGSETDNTLNYYLGGSARNTTVSVELKSGIPITRQTETGDLDFIEIRLVIGSLTSTYMDKKGSYVIPATVTLKLEYKPVSETEWLPAFGQDGTFKLSGKVTGNTVQEIRLNVERIDEPYEIRVTLPSVSHSKLMTKSMVYLLVKHLTRSRQQPEGSNNLCLI